MITNLDLPWRRVLRVCRSPRQYLPDFITSAKRELMLSMAFFCRRQIIISETLKSDVPARGDPIWRRSLHVRNYQIIKRIFYLFLLSGRHSRYVQEPDKTNETVNWKKLFYDSTRKRQKTLKGQARVLTSSGEKGMDWRRKGKLPSTTRFMRRCQFDDLINVKLFWMNKKYLAVLQIKTSSFQLDSEMNRYMRSLLEFFYRKWWNACEKLFS